MVSCPSIDLWSIPEKTYAFATLSRLFILQNFIDYKDLGRISKRSGGMYKELSGLQRYGVL